MSLTQYYTATTLDGFIADPNDSLDWLFTRDREEGGSWDYGVFIAEVGALAMGSTTYEWILDHEFKGKDPSEWKWPYDIPCWVFTHRQLPVVPDAKIEFTSGDVAPVHEQMVEAAGERNIWIVGGGDLAGQFADAGLLDEVHRVDRAGHARRRRAAAPAPDRAASGGARPERRLRRGPVLRQRGASAAGGSSIEARSATSAASGISISPRAGLSRSNVTYSSSVIRPAASRIVTTPRESAAR